MNINEFLIPESSTEKVNHKPLFCHPSGHFPQFAPPRSAFTLQEEFYKTIQIVNENIGRVQALDEAIRKTMDGFIAEITSDNTTFKDLCIATYNNFASALNNDITTFKSAITAGYELFKNDSKLTYDNFVLTINNANRNFENNVNERVTEINNYFKTNFSTTVYDELTRLKDNGELAEILTNSVLGEKLNVSSFNATLKTLATKTELEVEKARLNQLMSANTVAGSEIIDGRVDANGNAYPTIGGAIRGQYNDLVKKTSVASVFTNARPTLTYNRGDYVSLALNETTHIFYNGLRYDIVNAFAELSNIGTRVLFYVLFNPFSREIAIQPTANDIPDGWHEMGLILENNLMLNNHMEKNVATDVDSTRPLYVVTWTDEPPVIEKVDEVNYNVIFPQTVIIYYNGTKYSVGKCTVAFERESQKNLHCVLYDTVSKKIVIQGHGYEVPKGNLVIGLLNILTGVHLFGQGHKHSEPKTTATLILGATNKYVEFDSINKTVTFPDDTVIIAKNYEWYHHFALTNKLGNTTASWSHLTTSAVNVFYERHTKALVCLPYNSIISDDLILLCSIRTSTGSVACAVPYKWNGKLFNVFSEEMIDKINNENLHINSNIKSVDHRGNSEAPENTLSAFKLSARKGYKYVECDVSFTSDNVAVLLHDDTIDRTSNGTGRVNDLSYNTLKDLDFGSWFGSSYAGEKIPRFVDFIYLCKCLGLHPYIELKTSTAPTEEQIAYLVYTVKQMGMLRSCTWISFSNKLLKYVRNADPKARLGYLCSLTLSAIDTVYNDLKTDDNEVFIDVDYNSLNGALVMDAINKGIEVEVWTVKTDSDASTLLSEYPSITGITSDGVQTDVLMYNTALK